MSKKELGEEEKNVPVPMVHEGTIIEDEDEISIDDLAEFEKDIVADGDKLYHFYDAYAKHKDRVKKLESFLKSAKSNKEIAGKEMISAMKDLQLNKITIKGRNISWSDSTKYTVKAENRAKQYEWLRELGAGYLVEEVVYYQTFQTFYKNDFNVPDENGKSPEKPEFIDAFTLAKLSDTKETIKKKA